MKTLLVFISLLLFLSTSCKSPEQPTTPSNDEKHVSAFMPNRYAMASDIAYGPDPAQRLDIYSQGQSVGEPDWWIPDTQKHPTLIFIHGGGWVGGEKETRITSIIPYLERGWNVVNVEYRLGANTAPKAVDDAMCAIAWVADHAEEYNIDLNNIVISGGSAGGHLALITGFLNSIPDSHACSVSERLKVGAIINWYGITDIEKVERFLRTTKPDWNYAGAWLRDSLQIDSVSRYYSPVNRISEDTPPVLTLHGELDSVVPYDQAVQLHQLLEEAGLTHRLLSDPKGNHGGFSDQKYEEFYSEIFSFLDELNISPE